MQKNATPTGPPTNQGFGPLPPASWRKDMDIEPGTLVLITSGPDAGFGGTFECEWINPLSGELVYVVLANPADDDGDVYYAPSIKRFGKTSSSKKNSS